MHKYFLSLAIALCIVNTAWAEAVNNFNNYFIRAAKKAKPSVVTIIIYNRSGNGKTAHYQRVAFGSGTIISPDGYIVTNNHVLSKGNHYQVIANDGRPLKLSKLTKHGFSLIDQKTDIAILKIDTSKKLYQNAIEFENSNSLSEGEWVLAIGNPFGLKHSITSGIVSSKGRDNIGFTDIEDFIQTDVPINPGNSGGPLINLKGNLVGINTAIRTESGTYQGISFAIPSNIVRLVCNELIHYGRVRRGWLGFIVKECHYFSGGDQSQLEILSVIKKSPAEFAGLQKHDIIKEIDGEKITSIRSLIKAIGNKAVDTKINIKISRNSNIYSINLTLREKKVHQKIQNGLKKLFTRYGIEIDENADTGAIIISYISPGSISYGLKPGDILMSYNGIKISSLDMFIKIFYRNKEKIHYFIIYRDDKLHRINFISHK